MKKILYLNFLLLLMITMLPNVYAKEDIVTIDFKDNYNNIKLNDAMPVSDDVGKAIVPFKPSSSDSYEACSVIDFSIKSNVYDSENKTVEYEIYLTKDKLSTLEDQYVKLYLVNYSTDKGELAVVNPITYQAMNEKSDIGIPLDSKLLFKGVIEGDEVNNYRLKVWLSNNYLVTQERKKFAATIGVVAKVKGDNADEDIKDIQKGDVNRDNKKYCRI